MIGLAVGDIVPAARRWSLRISRISECRLVLVRTQPFSFPPSCNQRGSRRVLCTNGALPKTWIYAVFHMSRAMFFVVYVQYYRSGCARFRRWRYDCYRSALWSPRNAYYVTCHLVRVPSQLLSIPSRCKGSGGSCTKTAFRLALDILHTYVVFHGVFGYTIRVLIGVAIGYVITVLLHYR